MTRTLTRTTFVSIAILGAALVSTAAIAQERTDDQRSVQVARTDFNQPQQVHALYGRIKAAAHSVCTSEGAVDPRTQQADAACETQATSDAVRDINQPQLSREDERDTGRAHQYAWNDRK